MQFFFHPVFLFLVIPVLFGCHSNEEIAPKDAFIREAKSNDTTNIKMYITTLHHSFNFLFYHKYSMII